MSTMNSSFSSPPSPQYAPSPLSGTAFPTTQLKSQQTLQQQEQQLEQQPQQKTQDIQRNNELKQKVREQINQTILNEFYCEQNQDQKTSNVPETITSFPFVTIKSTIGKIFHFIYE